MSEVAGIGVKVWVGNLDRSVTEYQLLRLCERFGEVAEFDFLYSFSDTGVRTPRGYAFVTFRLSSAAERAVKELHGVSVLGRQLIVRYANPRSERERGLNRTRPIPQALSMKGKAGDQKGLTDNEKADKIKALEAKLKAMEGTTEEFKVEATVPSTSRTKAKPYSRPHK